MNQIVDILNSYIELDYFQIYEKLLPEIDKLDDICFHLIDIVLVDTSDSLSLKQAAARQLYFYVRRYLSKIGNRKDELKSRIIESVVNFDGSIRYDLLNIYIILVENKVHIRWNKLENELMTFLSNDNRANWFRGYLCLERFTDKIHFGFHACIIFSSFGMIMKNQMEILLNCCSKMSVETQTCILHIMSKLLDNFMFRGTIPVEVFTFWIETVFYLVNTLDIKNERNVLESRRTQCTFELLQAIIRSRFTLEGLNEQFNFWDELLQGEKVFLTLSYISKQLNDTQSISDAILKGIFGVIEEIANNALLKQSFKMNFPSFFKDIVFPLLKFKGFARREFKAQFGNCILMDPILVLQFITSILDSNDAPEIEKASAFFVMGVALDVIIFRKQFFFDLDQFINYYLLPLNPKSGSVLKEEILLFIFQIAHSSFNNEVMLSSLVTEVISAFEKDPDIKQMSISYDALHALLLNKKPQVKEAVNSCLERFVDHIMTTLNISLTPIFYGTIKIIIKNYTSGKDAILMRIISGFKDLYLFFLSGSRNKTHADFQYIVKILNCICKSLDQQQAVFVYLEQVICEIILFVINHNVWRPESKIIGLTSILITDSMRKNKLSINILRYVVEQQTEVETGNILRVMRSIQFPVTDTSAVPHIDSYIVGAINEMFSQTLDNSRRNRSFEIGLAAMVEVLLLNHPGQLDQYIPEYIRIATKNIEMKIHDQKLFNLYLGIIIASLYNNRYLTQRILVKNNWPGTDRPMFDYIIYILFLRENHAYTFHDLQMAIRGICTVLSTAVEMLPDYVHDLPLKTLVDVVRLADKIPFKRKPVNYLDKLNLDDLTGYNNIEEEAEEEEEINDGNIGGEDPDAVNDEHLEHMIY